jgi:hypothetical protein
MNKTKTATLLPAATHVVAHAAEPGRVGLRLIQLALDHGWSDEPAQGLARAGRDAISGTRWTASAGLDNSLILVGEQAFDWLVEFACPAGFELVNCQDTVALVREGLDDPCGEPQLRFPAGVTR